MEASPKYTWTKLLRSFDLAGFILLSLYLVSLVVTSGKANIQTDSIDYYAILQKLINDQGSPIVGNLPFVEQRSPGYPILSMIPCYLTTALVEPFIKTETVTNPANLSSNLPKRPSSETLLLPSEPLLFKDIFFKNIPIDSQDSWFKWKLISALLFISYGAFFIGLIFSGMMLMLFNKPVHGASLVPLIVITMPIFMHNLINTPAYATLTTFGLSSVFCYFFVKGFIQKKELPKYLSGFFLGLLVLTRLETIVLIIIVLLGLLVCKEYRFLRNVIIGALIPAAILLLYNTTQFGNPFHAGILEGNINLIMLDFRYISMNVINPQSGILFWSTLGSIGIIGLFLDNQPYSKIIGIGSLCLFSLTLIRIPVMYTCIGEGAKIINGLPIACPKNLDQITTLVRFDANRYITVLIPFSILGLRRLVSFLPPLWKRIRAFI